MHQHTVHMFQVRMLECITWQLHRDITDAEATIAIAAQWQGRTKKEPDP